MSEQKLVNQTLANLWSFAKFAKVFPRQCFPLYGMWSRSEALKPLVNLGPMERIRPIERMLVQQNMTSCKQGYMV